MEARLATGRSFILGSEPGLPDALCYHLVWFIRGRYAGGPEFLSQFPNLAAWEKRVADIGHGQPSGMTADEALAIAKAAASETETRADPGDPQGLAPGLQVAVVPAGTGGDPPVSGEIVSVSADEIAVRRSHDRVGEVVVHFPRVGYEVSLSGG